MEVTGLTGNLWPVDFLGQILQAGEAGLPFSIPKVVFFLGWFYLCLHSVKRSDASPLVSKKYRSLSNLAALFIGPLALFVLFVGDTVQRIQDGVLDAGDVVQYTVDAVFGPRKKKRVCVGYNSPAIEFLTIDGKTFSEVYLRTIRDRSLKQEAQIRTERIIADALQTQARSILIDPKDESWYTIQFFGVGFLQDYQILPTEKIAIIIDSFKAICGMDIEEKQHPQKGVFMIQLPEAKLYLRMDSSGTFGGERLAIQILGQNAPEEIDLIPKYIE